MVGKTGQSQAHLVNLGFNVGLDLKRQLEEAEVETLVINLEGRAHRLGRD